MGRGFQATGNSLGMALFIYKVFLPHSNYTITFKDFPAYKMSKHQKNYTCYLQKCTSIFA